MLTGLVADLPELERQVILMRFFQELNQDAIAARVGSSQMQVSRLLRRALARMRAQHLQPEYFSFMPSGPRVAQSAPDTGAEYLGGGDAPS